MISISDSAIERQSRAGIDAGEQLTSVTRPLTAAATHRAFDEPRLWHGLRASRRTVKGGAGQPGLDSEM